MSFDLCVWYPQEKISLEAARALYQKLCEGDNSGVVPHPAVKAFYEELIARHPEIDSLPEEKIGDHDYSPWSCALDHSQGHILMASVWPKAEYVGELVGNLAQKHGLALYDPQSDEVYYPSQSADNNPGPGMSRTSRWILGSFAALFGAILVYSDHLAHSKAPWLVYAVAGFCFLIALACFRKRVRGPAIRAIGLMVFAAYAFYLIFELLREPSKPYMGVSVPHWQNAIHGLLAFGLPGLFVFLRGAYPKWGSHAKVFGDSNAEKNSQNNGS